MLSWSIAFGMRFENSWIVGCIVGRRLVWSLLEVGAVVIVVENWDKDCCGGSNEPAEVHWIHRWICQFYCL